MAAIPGILFVLIGFIVLGSSLFINISQKSNSMLLFVIAGIFLVLWGLIKILFFEKKGKIVHKAQQQMPQHYSQPYQHQRAPPQNMHSQHPYYRKRQ